MTTPKASKASTLSPKSAIVDFEEVRLAMIQSSLDLWQHNMVSSKMAQTWGRKQILAPLLDVMELIGVDVPDGIETLLRMEEEEDMVYYISDHMPLNLMESFEDIIFEVQQAANHLSSLRRSLEAEDAAAVLKVIEESESQPSTSVQILRVAAEHAAQEVARLKNCHGSWRTVTEARIHRLEHAKDEAEKATQDFLAIEAKLGSFRGIVSEKSRACLMGMVMGSKKGMMSACVAAWRGATEEGKVHQSLRVTYEAQLQEMQTQILNHQAERLRNVRNAMARSFVENNDHLIRALFQSWVNDTEQSKRRNVGERELDKAQAHFFHVKASRVASSRKIVAQMILDAELAPLVMCLQAWTQFVEEEAKEKAAEERVQAVERQLQEVMVVRKQRVVKVIETMLRKQEEDFQFELFQCWVQQCQEEKQMRVMDDNLGVLSGKMSMLKTRQRETAAEVRTRMNTQADNILLFKFMSGWKQSSKAEGLEKFYHRKLDNKRKQVAGVQTLFQTFAQQIEHNLDDDDDEEPGPETRRKIRHPQGMQRGGMAVSLPDIHRS